MKNRRSDTPRDQRGAQAEFARQMRERGYSEPHILAGAQHPARAPAEDAGEVVTVSGRRVSLLQPEPAAFCADDIAHGLSHVCRFSGQVSTFYSVAQHSMLVAALAPRSLRRYALLHDASEAYIQDVPSPLKVLLPTYNVLEARFQRVIEMAFDLSPLDAADRAIIKEADLMALSVEMRDLFAGHFDAARSRLPMPPAAAQIHGCLPPPAAKVALLAEMQAAQLRVATHP